MASSIGQYSGEVEMISGGGMRGNMPGTKQFAGMSLNLMSPKHSVIIDMVMIQLISAILCSMLILALKGNEINQMDASFMMMGIFASVMLLGGIYTRINRM